MKKIYIAISACLTLLWSCNLDLKPTTSIAYDPAGQLIETADNLKAFENGILSRFRATLSGDYDMVEEVMLDGFNAASSFGNRYGTVHRVDATFDATNEYVTDQWAGYYVALKDYNILIASLDNVPAGLEKDAAVVKGEALFFRAYTYLQLARHFGKAYSTATAATDLCVPLVLVYDQLEKPARATVAKVYEQIETDLKEAAKLLAEVPGSVRAIRPTVDAVYALQARAYLDMKNYPEALAAARKVISSEAGYAIASTAKEMEDEYVNDKGKEPIFQPYVRISSEMPATKRIFTYNNQNADKVEVYAPDYLPTKALVDSYSDGDLRKAAWFTDSKHPVEYSRVSYTGKFQVFIKFEGNPALTSALLNGANAPKPLKIGEMYLIAAEAALESNLPDAARVYLNELQNKRKANVTIASMENIKKEWFRETVGDGVRLSCLKRWGDGCAARVAQPGALEASVLMTGATYDERVLAANNRAFVWPIPSYEMKINENLIQNDGYTKE